MGVVFSPGKECTDQSNDDQCNIVLVGLCGVAVLHFYHQWIRVLVMKQNDSRIAGGITDGSEITILYGISYTTFI